MKPVHKMRRLNRVGYALLLMICINAVTGCASKPSAIEKPAAAPSTKTPHSKAKVSKAAKAGQAQPLDPECCKAYPTLKFDSLVVGTEVKFRISPQGQVVDFPEGGSYYLAIELPPLSSAYTLEVTSRLVGSKRIEETHVFYPTLLFLDQDHRVVATLDPALKPMHTRKYGEVFTTRLATLPTARYLVFYTDKSRVQERLFIRMTGSTSTLSPGTNRTAGGMLYSNRGATGQLHLRLDKKE